jgi:hypothetical protein
LKLTIHLQLVPSSRKRGSKHPLHPVSSWRCDWLAKHKFNQLLLNNVPLHVFRYVGEINYNTFDNIFPVTTETSLSEAADRMF